MKKVAIALSDVAKIIASQVGCGYCKHEKDCPKHDPKINKAKLGCEEYEHHLAPRKS